MSSAGGVVRASPGRTDKTHSSDGSLTISEMRRREDAARDQQVIVTRCAADGCEWSHEGPAGEARGIAAQHRTEAHPDVATFKRCVVPGCDRDAKPSSPMCATHSNRGRAAKATVEEPEPTRPLESADVLGPDTAATEATASRSSGSSTAAPNPGPEAAMPTMKRPPKPRGYWTLDRIVEGFKEHHRRTGSAPSTALLNGSQGPVPEYVPAYTSMRKVATYEAVLAAAGLEAPPRAKPTAKARTASPPWVAPPPPRVAKTVTGGTPEKVVQAVSLVDLAKELEASKADLDKAQARYLAARAAIRNHDSVREAA